MVQGDLRVVDHLTDIADALGALRARLAVVKNRLDRRGPRLDGGMSVTFADGVTVTDVHGKLRLMTMRMRLK